jgi:hypothetical protein
LSRRTSRVTLVLFYAHSLLPKRRTQMKSDLLFFLEQSPSLSRP